MGKDQRSRRKREEGKEIGEGSSPSPSSSKIEKGRWNESALRARERGVEGENLTGRRCEVIWRKSRRSAGA